MGNTIKDKIRKLLALAESPYEHEARAALLKAKELMVQHKLSEEDMKEHEAQNLKRAVIGCFYTPQKGSWKSQLAVAIAENYCCKCFVQRGYNKKLREIGFIGLEDDFSVCNEVFKYAVKFVESQEKIMKMQFKDIYVPKHINKIVDAYGQGFAEGLNRSFEEQKECNESFAIVMQTPQDVLDAVSDMKEDKSSLNFDLSQMEIMSAIIQGSEDGKNFNPQKTMACK